ncbi:hypothetical protein PAXINDRAFT_96707 [Paxillus involutus ATCC 200175]|nr:hypothetical protein PAXINDRAFT_96707 [Paxillus involutus ATCC 200175]
MSIRGAHGGRKGWRKQKAASEPVIFLVDHRSRRVLNEVPSEKYVPSGDDDNFNSHVRATIIDQLTHTIPATTPTRNTACTALTALNSPTFPRWYSGPSGSNATTAETAIDVGIVRLTKTPNDSLTLSCWPPLHEWNKRSETIPAPQLSSVVGYRTPILPAVAHQSTERNRATRLGRVDGEVQPVGWREA